MLALAWAVLVLGGAKPAEIVASKGASLLGKTVYVEVAGVVMRGVVKDVRDDGLTAIVLGNEIAIPYESLSPRRLFRLARRAAGKDDPELLVGLLSYAKGLPKLAREAEDLEAFIRENFPGTLKSEKKPRPKPVRLTKRPSPPPPRPKKGPHRTPGSFLTRPRGSFRGIHRGHPKIFVRDAQKAAPCGLTLTELRRRCASPPWSSYAARLREYPQYGSFYSIPNLAMKYLARGDEQAADRVVEILTGSYPRDATTTEGDLVEAAAIGYDWVYSYPGFSGEEKQKARENLLRAAQRLRGMMYEHVWHTRTYAWTNGVLFAGLALHPEEPEGEKLAHEALKHYREDLFPARRLHDGMWQNGMAYGRKYMTRSVFHALSAWSSATGEDLWWEIASREENWAERMLYGFIYACRPDYTYVTYGDFFGSFWTARWGSFDNLLDATQGARNPFGKGFLLELEKRYGGRALEPHRAYYFPLFWDASLPARPKAALPKCELFSRHGMGCAFFRSGWGPDDLFVFFKCGDYYGDHGHFDQGTFEIFCRKPLAVDSGSYTGGFRGPHRMRYARCAVAHNTLVFPERSKPDDEGGQRIFQAQGTKNPASHPKTCDTGDILAFEDAPACARVLADLARAYDGVKVFYRHMVYAKPNVIVVFDAVSLPARRRRVFLYHYPTSAEVGKGYFRVKNGSGELVARVLLPSDAEIRDAPGFKVGSRDYAPRGRTSGDIAGKGRVEIEPRRETGETTYFLVVMTVGGSGVRPVACSLKETPGALVLNLRGARYFFGKDGRSFRRE